MLRTCVSPAACKQEVEARFNRLPFYLWKARLLVVLQERKDVLPQLWLQVRQHVQDLLTFYRPVVDVVGLVVVVGVVLVVGDVLVCRKPKPPIVD